MKTLTVTSSRSGESHLVVCDSPWPVVALANLVGHYQPRWGADYVLWNAILEWCGRFDRRLVAVPISHSCEIVASLWGRAAGECYHVTLEAEE